jgi:uroporphyrinogen III methyltransferase/synthase
VTVYLVGAGPGDPGLLTRRGAALLARADIVLHDRLVSPAILELVPPSAELIDVGHGATMGPGASVGQVASLDQGVDGAEERQSEIARLLVEYGRRAAVVVRLKGGDPFLFGRGGEEVDVLTDAGIAWEIVPGVTSAFGVPAVAGIPVTHRGVASSVTVATGRVGDGAASSSPDWDALARTGGTLVILMGMRTRSAIADALIAGGRSPDTPTAVIARGTMPGEQVVRTTLAGLADVDLAAPAVIVVGEVAALGTVRPSGGVGPLLRAAAAGLSGYDWLVVTSVNAVDRFMAELRDARALAGVRVGAVGPATADALRRTGVEPDLVPAQHSAHGLVEEFPTAPAPGSGSTGRVLFPCADLAPDTLARGLAHKGWEVVRVEAYRTVPGASPDPALFALVEAADAMVFTATSSVRAFLALRSSTGMPVMPPAHVVCIGPTTAAAAEKAGFKGVHQAWDTSTEGIVAELVESFGPDGGRSPAS